MIKTEIRPLAGFEEDYARYVDRKAKVEEEIKFERDVEIANINSKYDNMLAERTSKLDRLIAETSEIVETEVEDEIVEENEENISSEIESEEQHDEIIGE